MNIKQMIRERDALTKQIEAETRTITISNLCGDTPAEEFKEMRDRLELLCLESRQRDVSGYDGTSFVFLLDKETAKHFKGVDMF